MTKEEGKTKKGKTVRSILISQPEPSRSPYFDIRDKYDITIDFRQFIQVEPVEAKFFRRQRICFLDYTAVVFTSKNAVDHFFERCEETRVKMSAQTRYFCMSQAVANYLQKFIVYRKRKVFVGERTIDDLKEGLLKYKTKDKILLPSSTQGSKSVANFLTENDFDYDSVQLYQTVSSDLSDLSDIKYDMLVFFSPLGIHSLFENFPDFVQNETRIAIFGNTTMKAANEHKLRIDIQAPAPGTPSMNMAIEKYIKENN